MPAKRAGRRVRAPRLRLPVAEAQTVADLREVGPRSRSAATEGSPQTRHSGVVLVFGGARSGKSRFASQLAEGTFKKPLYLATAEALDAEMAERIELHKKARGSRWLCLEEPLDIARVISRPPKACDGILLDCLTLWLTNVLMKEGEKAVKPRRNELIAALEVAGVPVILVSNEVGMGIVPESKLGRAFRDLAGWLNQDVATVADTVVFVAAGLPMVLKGKTNLFESHKTSEQ